jgi:Galactosyltransferase
MRVLIAVLSCARDAEQDQVCRETWLRDCPVDYKFFVGQDAPPTHSDIVNLPCGDGYLDLPFKTQEICKWAVLRHYDFIFKCDNDTYVRVDRLLASGFASYSYSGFDWAGAGGYCSGGAGYWLSKIAAAHVADATLVADYGDETRRSLKGEDLQIGEALRAVGILPHGDDRYHLRLPGPEPGNNIITLHDIITPCKGKRMVQIHEQF